MRKTRKLAAASLAACMGITLLAGCSSSGDGDAQKDGNDSGGAKEITLMASQNWIKDVDNELFDKFEEETGIEVQVSLTPDNEYRDLSGSVYEKPVYGRHGVREQRAWTLGNMVYGVSRV